MKKTQIILLLILLSMASHALDYDNSKVIYTKIDSIDYALKKIKLFNQSYSYQLKFGDVLYLSLFDQKKIESIDLNKKYYIEIKYKNSNYFDLKKDGVVVFIGKIKPPI